jgi:glycosyltransferase involved in cell wall biosynthesis
MSLHIGIIGSRGIPNRYGGFEQLATYLAAGLVERGFRVTVYNPHHHPYTEAMYKGASIVKKKDPERFFGTAGQFIYDFNCIRDARRRDFDVLLFLGYTSSSVWRRWFPQKAAIVCNMDGLEWKRTKYKPWQQRFLRYAERLAVRHSDYLISDAPAIQQYLLDSFGAVSRYIAYGAAQYADASATTVEALGLQAGQYLMLMARMEPENHIEMVADGIVQSGYTGHLFIVGSTSNRYGSYLRKRYAADTRIRFAGPVYDPLLLHALKQHCQLYFHGHSVGGTNPSLLEAMASGACIAAHDNEFNRGVLGERALYFSSVAEVRGIAEQLPQCATREVMIKANLEIVAERYQWPQIIDQYAAFLRDCHLKKNHERNFLS